MSPVLNVTDRTDHIWIKQDGRFKCALCGALTSAKKPPSYPTPASWGPERYEKLTAAERAQAPFSLGVE